jgi:hypothetical protein
MINWDTAPLGNSYFEADGRLMERQHHVEHRPLASLRMHETPSPRQVAKIARAMKAGEKIPMPLIGDDGMVLDGHHRLDAAELVEGKGAIVPSVVHRLIDITHQAAAVKGLAEHMSEACERAEAGFYFEEGGCFGMAIALHATLTAAGVDARLGVTTDFIHAYAVAHGHLYDYRGKKVGAIPPDFALLQRTDFLQFAAEHGHDENDLCSAQDYAQSAIDLALKLAAAATPGPLSTNPRVSGLSL